MLALMNICTIRKDKVTGQIRSSSQKLVQYGFVTRTEKKIPSSLAVLFKWVLFLKNFLDHCVYACVVFGYLDDALVYFQLS